MANILLVKIILVMEKSLVNVSKVVIDNIYRYTQLISRGHSPLDQHLKGILQWRPSNPIRMRNYMDV